MGNTDSSPTESSIVAAVVHDLRDVSRWLESSAVVQAYRRFTGRLDAAASNSALVALFSLLVHWTRASFCYRWLTKEPEPDVVVIDLRETYTVGPLIALLDRLAPTIERTWRGSRAYRLTDALQTSSKLEWIADSRTVQLLAAAVEPPELPEEAAEGSSEGDER
jgi:hypothetical protein